MKNYISNVCAHTLELQNYMDKEINPKKKLKRQNTKIECKEFYIKGVGRNYIRTEKLIYKNPNLFL